ncbi:DUF7312 domain-containing protein [Halalkalirubrum salinum]|uniref:DUF7312 domain-containing protein n=1 Tax=Halalkalirubrum salinum TaxID=2563889 RepID=UPI0010FB560B|nr:hypothetical protein [Halalkalirubrum salinum]
MRSSDRSDDGSATIDDEDTVASEDTVMTEHDENVMVKDRMSTDDAVAREPMPIVPEQISLENAAFVVLGVALTVVVILTAV